jgi:rhamnogalacturonyl hydrolase YesR
LIHERESYLETSTAGFFGGAFYRGIRLGILSSEFMSAAEKAWSAIRSRVDFETGDVMGVSAWTLAGTTFDDSVSMYKTLPTEVNWWGQGSAMRIAAERIYSGLE